MSIFCLRVRSSSSTRCATQTCSLPRGSRRRGVNHTINHLGTISQNFRRHVAPIFFHPIDKPVIGKMRITRSGFCSNEKRLPVLATAQYSPDSSSAHRILGQRNVARRLASDGRMTLRSGKKQSSHPVVYKYSNCLKSLEERDSMPHHSSG